MSVEDYPTIGFDPAPGKLTSIDDLVGGLSKTVDGLKKAHDVLTDIGKGKGQEAWQGEAATAFAEKVGELPKYLDDSHDALHTAEKELRDWHTKLTGYQETARRYEFDAKSAKSRENDAEARHSQATAAYNQAANDPALRYVGRTFQSQEALVSAQAQYDTAATRLREASSDIERAAGKVSAARGDLEDIIEKARTLLEKHQDYARATAGKLRKANETAPDPGFFESIGDAFDELGNSIKEWCTEHADLLKKIGDWLSIASTVLGVLALLTVWFPPLSGGLALASAGLSGGALLAHGAAKLGGAEVSTMDLVGDGLGIVPFGKLGAVAAKGAKVPMKVFKHNGASVKSIDAQNRIAGLAQKGHRLDDLEPSAMQRLLGKTPPDGSKLAVAEGGLGNRMKLAWDNHVLFNQGSSLKEQGLSYLVSKGPPSLQESLGSAIRADGTLDPTSWWSRGAQIAPQVPGIALGSYNAATGSEAPAAGR